MTTLVTKDGTITDVISIDESQIEGQLSAMLENKTLDDLEHEILDKCNLIDMPVVHRFVKNMYIREIFMQSGILTTSKIHKTEHPYSVMSGSCLVFIPGKGIEEISKGKFGITVPGTRRALFIKEDCIWITYHVLSPEEEIRRQEGAGDEELLSMIEDRIIEKRVLPGDDGKTTNELYREKLDSKQIGGE